MSSYYLGANCPECGKLCKEARITTISEDGKPVHIVGEGSDDFECECGCEFGFYTEAVTDW